MHVRIFAIALTVIAVATLPLTSQTMIPVGSEIDGATVAIQAYAFDAAGDAITLAQGDVTGTIDGEDVPVDVTLDVPGAARPVALYVMADVSASTASGNTSALIAAGAAAASVAIADAVDLIGLASFANVPTMLHGLTPNVASYTEALDDLAVGAGSDLQDALFNETMGGFGHLQNAPGGRTLLLILDGASTFDLDRALSAASTFRTEVYVIGVNAPIGSGLRQLAEESGGAWIENVAEQAEITAAVAAFVSKAKRRPNNVLSTTNPTPCDAALTIELTYSGVTRSVDAVTDVNSTSSLAWSPNGLEFGTDGTARTLQATVTCRGPEPISIESVSLANDDFVVEDPPSGVETLNPGDSRTFTIRYVGSAAGSYGELTLVATTSSSAPICAGTTLSLRGGPLNIGDRLRVTSPNGGESYIAGDGPVDITWTNTLPRDIVRIELSTNNGTSWSSITENATGLSYSWTPGPTATSEALIRIQRTAVPDSDVVVLSGSTLPVLSTVFANDGRWAITGGQDNTIRVWDANTGALIRQIGSHGFWVWDLDLSPGGQVLASGGHDASVRLWDLATGERIGTYLADGRVWSVRYSPDGSTLAIGTENSLTLVNTADLSRIESLPLPDARCQSTAFNADGSRILVAEGTIARLRDVKDLTNVVQTFSGHTAEIYAVEMSVDDRTAITGGADFTVRTWDANSGAQTAATNPARASILDLDVSPTGGQVASAGGDGTIKTWSLSDLSLLNSFAGHAGAVYSAQYDEPGDRIVSGATDLTGRVWNVTSAALVEDRSDATFSIVGGTPATADANHGTVMIGQSVDITTPMLTNTGTEDLVVHSARIVSGDVGDFALEAPGLPTTLGPGAQLTVGSAFKPTDDGSRTALIAFETGVGTASSVLGGDGNAADIVAVGLRPTSTSFLVDFGRHTAGQTVEDTIIRLSVPAGGEPVSITRTTLVGVQAGAFQILGGGGAFTISPTQSRELSVRFEPLEVARYGARLELTRGDGTVLVIRLYGEGAGDARIASNTPSLLFTTDPCDPSTTLQQVTVRNDGSSPLLIYNASINGANADEFTITSPPDNDFPVTIEAGSTLGFTVRFSPAVVGPKDAQLVMTSNGTGASNGTLVIPIVARRDSVGFELSLPTVNFENVNEGEQAIQLVSILNTGTVSLRWPSGIIDRGSFRIETIEPNITPPGGTSTFTVRFLGGEAGQAYDASYDFVDSVCQRTQTLDMRATVKSFIGATVSADLVRANIGSEVVVPVRISDKVNFDRTSVTQIQARLRVNGTILTPLGIESTFADGERTFDVTLPIPETGDLMTELRFRTTWGNDTSSQVIFDSVWVSDTILVRTQDGEVILDDLCREGGPRLFLRRENSPGIVAQVIPHPVSDNATVVLTVIERGPTTVHLIDVAGRVVQTLVDRELSPGRYLLPLDAHGIDIGSYTLTMRTRTQQVSNRISVVR